MKETGISSNQVFCLISGRYEIILEIPVNVLIIKSTDLRVIFVALTNFPIFHRKVIHN